MMTTWQLCRLKDYRVQEEYRAFIGGKVRSASISRCG